MDAIILSHSHSVSFHLFLWGLVLTFRSRWKVPNQDINAILLLFSSFLPRLCFVSLFTSNTVEEDAVIFEHGVASLKSLDINRSDPIFNRKSVEQESFKEIQQYS